MHKRSVRAADVDGRRALVRVDFNVPIVGGAVADDTRIRAALPTIQLLRRRGARVILMSHLGRPKSGPDPRLSLAPVARRLSELLGEPVTLAPGVVGPEVEVAAAALPPRGVLLLENVRFEAGEERDDPAFADHLARLGDLYVDDAFGSAHRAHASTHAVARRLPAYAGLLLERETSALDRLQQDPTRPFAAILGGAKVSDKLPILERLVDRVDVLLLGGGMANTFLLAEGCEIGRSLAERDLADAARAVLTRAYARGIQVLLPTDVVVAETIEAPHGRVVHATEIPENMAVFDIGPATIGRFAEAIRDARTIFWNGPMGVFERPPFAAGTLGVAVAVAESAAFSLIGGGDSIAAVAAAGVTDCIDHISTGGGAALEYLEGRELPGVAVLPDA